MTKTYQSPLCEEYIIEQENALCTASAQFFDDQDSLDMD